MSKSLMRLTLALLAASLCAGPAAAQNPVSAPSDWVSVSPAGEGFNARMPKQPSSSEQSVRAGGIEASGRRYSAGEGGATFIIWSLSDAQGEGLRLSAAEMEGSGVGVESLYLDRVAEVAWELIIAPELKRLRRKFGISPDAREVIVETGPVAIVYSRDFELSSLPAREYHVSIERERGRVYICADGAHIYVIAAVGPKGRDPRLKSFPDSFSLGPKGSARGAAPATDSALTATQAGPAALKADSPEPPQANVGGADAPVGAEGPYKHDAVTKKALITSKPEPGFTETARWFNVTGVARLRAVLSDDGRIKNISVVKPLPHGLTRMVLDAVRRIKFEPAQKDGRPVSQHVVFEYNFNIY